MKRIILTALILLLIILLGVTAVKGWQIGGIKVLSIGEIKAKNAELDTEIDKANKLAGIEYKKQVTDEEVNMKTLEEVKQQYHDLVVVNPETGEQTTPQLEKYEIEYLWTQIGNHAKQEGVDLKINVEKAFDPSTISQTSENKDQNTDNKEDETNKDDENNKSNDNIDGMINDMQAATVESTSTGSQNEKDEGNYDLTFEATGSYVSVADFIYAIENDSTLGFKIEDFSMTGSSKTVTARFTCKDIRIKKITQTSEQQVEAEEKDENDTNTANSTNSTKSSKSSNTINNTNTTKSSNSTK